MRFHVHRASKPNIFENDIYIIDWDDFMFIHRNKNSNRIARLNVRKALRLNGNKIANYRLAYFFYVHESLKKQFVDI